MAEMALWVWEQVISGNVANTCSNIINTYQVFKDFLQRHEKVEFTQDEFTPLLEKILRENEQLRQDLAQLMPAQSVTQTNVEAFKNNTNTTISIGGNVNIGVSHNR